MFFIKDREKALRRYDFFLIFLAVASVGLIIAEERMDFTEAEEGVFGFVDTAVWLIFVGDYFSRLFLAGDKKLYVKTHIIELIAILPFDALFKGLRSLRLFRMLRSTRALRILRLIRLAAYFGRAHRYASRFLRQHNFQYVLFFTVLTVLIGPLLRADGLLRRPLVGLRDGDHRGVRRYFALHGRGKDCGDHADAGGYRLHKHSHRDHRVLFRRSRPGAGGETGK
ncbi:MAG: ion transporter [Aminivibrio sp.]|nr:ion transporter [Aminivibrio sp.]